MAALGLCVRRIVKRTVFVAAMRASDYEYAQIGVAAALK